MGKRLPGGGRRGAGTQDAPPRDAVIGDNSREEAERVQLISFVSRLSGAEDEVQRAKGPYDAAKKAKNQIFALARAAEPTWTRKYLERRIEEMNSTTRENAEMAAQEARHRRWLGILTEEQAKLALGAETPQEVKDEAHWHSEGYKAGLRGQEAKAPPECGERFLQHYLKGHERGRSDSIDALAKNVPKPAGTTAEQIAAQAKADFQEDNPELDVDAAARKLKNDPAFMARSGGEEEPVTGPDNVEDGFEATPEELAGQTTRQAVVGAREGADDDEAVV